MKNEIIYGITEGLRIVGWITVICLSFRHKKCFAVDYFWFRIMSAFLMLTGSLNDILIIQNLHKSLWWFFANMFIIIFFIYQINRDRIEYNYIKNKRNGAIDN